MQPTPKIVFTPGEPAGIGPDLVGLTPFHDFDCQVTVVADPDLLHERARLHGVSMDWPEYRPETDQPISILSVPLKVPSETGQLDKKNAIYVLNSLKRATEGCLRKEFDALVTGPVHKGIINDAGIKFSGHTEYLAELTETALPVMMLAAGDLRVPLVTTHIPIKDVAQAITQVRVQGIISLVHSELRSRFGIRKPKIAICGLNPHAGEGGYIGTEESDVIIPAIQSLLAKGLDLIGPVPADTVFVETHCRQFDAVVAMYHDQGLPVLKRVGFGHAINITLGLPIIRVSVDHGTALDKAGDGDIDTGSLQAALGTAINMVNHSR